MEKEKHEENRGEKHERKREIAERVKRMAEAFKVVVVTGPRQVGKTTLLEQLMPQISEEMTKVTLDDEVLRRMAKEDPRMFLDMYPTPLFIDEVQYAPELFPYIKMKVDADKSGRKGLYLLSGSQAFNLMKGVSESLAGRAGIVEMNSFTYAEIAETTEKKVCFDPEDLHEAQYIDVKEAFERIFWGGMPELYNSEGLDRFDFFSSYVETFIERDIREMKEIGNLEDFRRFMKDLALRNGKPLNYSDIAGEIGVSSHTVKEWVSVLAATRVVYLLEPFYSKKLERLTHRPEVIFMDAGLASYLTGWESPLMLAASEYAGSFFEAYVIAELIKGYNNAGKQINFTYLRNKETEEIDLIIEKNQRLYPLEIKKTANPKKEMLKNFRYLEKTDKQVGVGGLVCLYDKMFELEPGRYVLPLGTVINAHKG